MSKVSIYENGWINLVFEGKNKEYGAYQLRQETQKTTIIALFSGLLFIATVASIPAMVNYFSMGSKVGMSIPDFTTTTIQLSDIKPNVPKTPEKHVIPTVKKTETNTPVKKVPLKDPVIVSPIDANQNIGKNKDNTTTTVVNILGTPSLGTSTALGTAGPGTTGPGVDITNPTDTGSTIVTTVALDKLPEFPGGLGKFYSFVGSNFEKPEIEGEKTVSVLVSFVIEKDGSITDIQVKRDPGYGLGKEAIRVLKSLKTKWSPGMIGGKAVRTSYNLPITVKME